MHNIIARLLIVLTVLQCIFIYMMSAAPADESADMSGRITYRIAKVIYADLDEMDEAVRLSRIETIDFVIRKCAHMTEYAVLGALLFGDFVLVFYMAKKRAACFAWLAGVAYAAGDEWHQTFVPGRSGEIRDVCIDGAGVVIGVAGMALLLWMIGKVIKKDKRR